MKIIAGVDEVGRGSLIGPVYAAAVILNKSINKKLLKDWIYFFDESQVLLSQFFNDTQYQIFLVSNNCKAMELKIQLKA